MRGRARFPAAPPVAARGAMKRLFVVGSEKIHKKDQPDEAKEDAADEQRRWADVTCPPVAVTS